MRNHTAYRAVDDMKWPESWAMKRFVRIVEEEVMGTKCILLVNSY